jgi:hypothetical protein
MASAAEKQVQFPSARDLKSAPTPDEVRAATEQTFMPLLRSYNVWLDSAAKMQAESLRFILDRVRKDLEIPARLAECKSPVDVLEVQASFASTMVSDYLNETGKLLSLTMEGVRESASEAEQQTRRG